MNVLQAIRIEKEWKLIKEKERKRENEKLT